MISNNYKYLEYSSWFNFKVEISIYRSDRSHSNVLVYKIWIYLVYFH
jgi:hypothetical protein